jgi:hypothetical protein
MELLANINKPPQSKQKAGAGGSRIARHVRSDSDRH